MVKLDFTYPILQRKRRLEVCYIFSLFAHPLNFAKFVKQNFKRNDTANFHFFHNLPNEFSTISRMNFRQSPEYLLKHARMSFIISIFANNNQCLLSA